MEITCDQAGFSVATDSYTLACSAADAQATLRPTAGAGPASKLALVPAVDGVSLENFRITRLSTAGERVELAAEAGGGTKIAMSFLFQETGFSYGHELDETGGLTKFGPGELTGTFRQVHYFGPDLPCFDIPEKVELPIQISSRRVQYDRYFQLDHGNYMMPPYLLALGNDAGLIGLGLLDVPDVTIPFDALVGVNRLALTLDYEGRKRPDTYRSPRLAVLVANDRTGILAGYHALVEQSRPNRARPAPDWSHAPIYTSWGDQVYRKHIEEGRFTSEAGSEKYLSAELVDGALETLRAEHIWPGTIVLDEGWARALGEWNPDDVKFGGSLRDYVRAKQEDGLRVVLHFNPFLVDPKSAIAKAHPDWLVHDTDNALRTVERSGREYHLFDWSCEALRGHLDQKIRAMLGHDGLNADGLKIAGTKFLPDPTDRMAAPEFGFGESYLLAALQNLRAFVREVDGAAPIFLPCQNPLFADCFDVVRLGNTSEVNHELYVQRAETASWLLPEKPIDTDDWAAWQKTIGATTFVKALTGIPNVFSAFYRGDGRIKVQGALGGCPVHMPAELYRVVAAAWKLYAFAPTTDRARLQVDFERMQFAAGRPESPPFIRSYQGGNTLAVYSKQDVYLASLLDTTLIIDPPKGFEPKTLERIDHNGNAEPTPFQRCLGGKLMFEARSSRDDTWYYQLRG